MYSEDLQTFIFEENKLVTYKWLCLTLNVKANFAKQLLYQFIDKHKNEESKLTVSYIISGSTYDNKLKKETQVVSIIREENLEKFKENLCKIYSLHIYSVQNSTVKDLNVLSAANIDIAREKLFDSSKFSGIICPSVATRNIDIQIQSPVIKKEQPVPVPTAVSKKPTSPFLFSNKAKSNEKVKETTKVIENKENNQCDGNATVESKKAKLTKSTALASMFKKQAQKVEQTSVKVSLNEQSKVPKSPFKSETKVKLEDNEDDSGSQQKVLDIATNKSNIKKSFSKNSTKTKKTISKRKSEDKSAASSKRRRVITLDSSSESSEEEEEFCLDENPLPAIPESSPAIEEKNSFHSKGRKGKLVDKTYQDDDGFLITKKEFVYSNDASDDEESPLPTPPPPKKASPMKKPPTKKAVQSTGTKQSNIMSFFKKKN